MADPTRTPAARAAVAARPPMAHDDVPVLPRGVRVHRDQVREQWVLLAPERAVTLDHVAHAVLSEVDGARSFGEIVATLAERYAAPPEQIAQDAAGFLGALRDRRFLEVRP